MVMEPLPSFEDLVRLFGAEPTYADGGPPAEGAYGWRYPWPYTSVKFEAVLVRLQLTGVRTVGVDRAKGRELLRVEFPDEASAATLWLRMKPDVALRWAYDSTS
ncbi:hypothetical protein [Dactylosporangium sp. CA-233914]|uniref:hypothetical protein n=1 Tax=Dactylosporangium sp. CA-233914 TaxID=3239934 RepID=UPI003D8EB424